MTRPAAIRLFLMLHTVFRDMLHVLYVAPCLQQPSIMAHLKHNDCSQMVALHSLFIFIFIFILFCIYLFMFYMLIYLYHFFLLFCFVFILLCVKCTVTWVHAFVQYGCSAVAKQLPSLHSTSAQQHCAHHTFTSW